MLLKQCNQYQGIWIAACIVESLININHLCYKWEATTHVGYSFHSDSPIHS